jgi:nucleoside-diphosphate-sugar epimerase
MAMNFLITGANGFVGRHLCEALDKRAINYKSVLRKANAEFSSHSPVVIAEINSQTDWSDALGDVGCVVHLAARVHVMQEAHANPLEEYRRANVDSTLNLAHQAANAGVKRFVFISSAKVNGQFNHSGRPFRADDLPRPSDPYAVSKLEAESALMQLSRETGMEVVVIRPPLIYGAVVKANFFSIMRLLNLCVPLPFGSIQNQRSLVFVDNLVDLIVRVLDHPNAAGQVFLVSDDEDVSTTRLLKTISIALGKQSWLIPVPVFLLKALFVVSGRRDLSDRLLSSFKLDISQTKKILDWEPPVRFEAGIKATTTAYLDTLK